MDGSFRRFVFSKGKKIFIDHFILVIKGFGRVKMFLKQYKRTFGVFECSILLMSLCSPSVTGNRQLLVEERDHHCRQPTRASAVAVAFIGNDDFLFPWP